MVELAHSFTNIALIFFRKRYLQNRKNIKKKFKSIPKTKILSIGEGTLPWAICRFRIFSKYFAEV